MSLFQKHKQGTTSTRLHKKAFMVWLACGLSLYLKNKRLILLPTGSLLVWPLYFYSQSLLRLVDFTGCWLYDSHCVSVISCCFTWQTSSVCNLHGKKAKTKSNHLELFSVCTIKLIRHTWAGSSNHVPVLLIQNVLCSMLLSISTCKYQKIKRESLIFCVLLIFFNLNGWWTQATWYYYYYWWRLMMMMM